MDDVILTLYENAIGTAETWTITVIWVKDWSLRTGAASESDAKISYQLKYQTSNLGLLGTPTTWGQRHFGGLIAYEMRATVQPAKFRGVHIEREVTELGAWTRMPDTQWHTLCASILVPNPDTSKDIFVDETPKDNFIYDIDVPGIYESTIQRGLVKSQFLYRARFKTHATFQGEKCSDDVLHWANRAFEKFTTNTIRDIVICAGDNAAGVGSAPTGSGPNGANTDSGVTLNVPPIINAIAGQSINISAIVTAPEINHPYFTYTLQAEQRELNDAKFIRHQGSSNLTDNVTFQITPAMALVIQGKDAKQIRVAVDIYDGMTKVACQIANIAIDSSGINAVITRENASGNLGFSLNSDASTANNNITRRTWCIQWAYSDGGSYVISFTEPAIIGNQLIRQFPVNNAVPSHSATLAIVQLEIIDSRGNIGHATKMIKKE